MSVLFETGELNAYVYDVVGSTDGNTFRTEGKGRATTITLVGRKASPVHSNTGITKAHERTARRPLVGR